MAAKGLTREMLTRAAVQIVDSDGLDALSMRRLGVELGVDPMAAYRHIPNKAILLDAIVEAVMSEIDTDAVDASLPWQDQLRSLARSYLATLMAHPHAAPLIAERSLRTAGSLRVAEKALRIMTDGGVRLVDAVATIDTIGLLAPGITQAANASPEPADDRFSWLPHQDFPLMARAVEAGARSRMPADMLDFAVDAMIAALVTKALPAGAIDEGSFTVRSDVDARFDSPPTWRQAREDNVGPTAPPQTGLGYGPLPSEGPASPLTGNHQ